MSYIILNKCDYFSRGLATVLNEAGAGERDIHYSAELSSCAQMLQQGTARITFLSESDYTTATEWDDIKSQVFSYPETLFIIFMRVAHASFDDYVYIKSNVIVMAQNVAVDVLKNIIINHRLTKSTPPTALIADERIPLSFSKRESEILTLWMAQRSSVEISEHINIKLKTVLSHKNNLRRKSKSRRTKVLFQIINLARSLTATAQLN